MMITTYLAFVLLSILCVILQYLAWRSRERHITGNNPNFLTFQRKYFSAYFLAMIADWLQGPYLYKLYSYYGYEQAQIAVLYVCGFASAVILGTWAPFVANNYGRRNLCVAFTILYTLSCFMKLSTNYALLILGRVLGGVSTSLLFSSYEAWYIHEHLQTHDFPSEWIPVTMTKASVWNGGLAVLSGVLANAVAEWFRLGPVSPFMLAVPCLLTSGIVVMTTWSENYGQQRLQFKKACIDGLREIGEDKAILLVGAVQSLFESVLYIIVFLWTPVLQPGDPSLGIVFSSFMVCITIGTVSHELLVKRVQNIMILAVSITVAFTATSLCSWFAHPDSVDTRAVFMAFLMYEISVGLYFAAMAKLREEILPEKQTTSIMNWFRVPLNLIACIVLMLLHDANFRHGNRYIFVICSILLCCALVCTTSLAALLKTRAVSIETENQAISA